MKVVRKKILPEYFQAVRAREKNFEIRLDEDDIQVGDLLILEDWDGTYTGNGVRRYVKYVLREAAELGLMPGYCIIDGKNQLKKDSPSVRPSSMCLANIL